MILADSGPIVSLFHPRDPGHDVVRTFLEKNREPVAIPACIIPEVSYFLAQRATAAVEAAFLRSLVSGNVVVYDHVAADYLRAAELVEQYAGFPLGAVDALVVSTAERIGVTTVLTLDRRHFGAVRPRHVGYFVLVP